MSANEYNPVQQAPAQATLRDVVIDLWQAKTYILVGMAALGLMAVAFLQSANPHYRAHMMVSPANPMNNIDSKSMLGEDSVFALRYLAQRVGMANGSDFARFENTYGGMAVAKELINDPKIIAGLAADQGFKFSSSKTSWSAAELSAYIQQRVQLESVGTSTLRRMTYLHPNKEFGVYFINVIHKITDAQIRQDVFTQASERVRYLKDSVAQTSNPEHRRALTALLLEQERLKMLSSIDMPYAANVVEAPATEYKTAWPLAGLVMVGALLIGAFAGYVAYEIKMARKLYQARSLDPESIWFKTDSSNANHPLTNPKKTSEPAVKDQAKSA